MGQPTNPSGDRLSPTRLAKRAHGFDRKLTWTVLTKPKPVNFVLGSCRARKTQQNITNSTNKLAKHTATNDAQTEKQDGST